MRPGQALPIIMNLETNTTAADSVADHAHDRLRVAHLQGARALERPYLDGRLVLARDLARPVVVDLCRFGLAPVAYALGGRPSLGPALRVPHSQVQALASLSECDPALAWIVVHFGRDAQR